MSVRVDIWSDVACPWCYIGKRKFEAGVAEAGVDVDVEYHSYQLAPHNPVEIEKSYYEYFAGRLGVSELEARTMTGSTTRVAASVGLHYNFDQVQPTNTATAHELLHYAKEHGKQQEMNDRLLRAYFEKGRHLGRIDDLVEVAREIGLDPDGVRAALETHQYAPQVHADLEAAARIGVTSVPFFLIDSRYALSGAQESQTFAEALTHAAQETTR